MMGPISGPISRIRVDPNLEPNFKGSTVVQIRHISIAIRVLLFTIDRKHSLDID